MCSDCIGLLARIHGNANFAFCIRRVNHVERQFPNITNGCLSLLLPEKRF